MAKSVKPSRAFFGRDTYGRHVERALGVNGIWYARHDEPSNYGIRPTKWYVTDEPNWQTRTENAYSGEISEHAPICLWGWNKMDEYTEELPRFRLPIVETV